MPLPIIQTLGENTLALLLERFQDAATRQRQLESQNRVDILTDDWRSLLWAYIHWLYPEQDEGTVRLVKALKRRATTTINVLSRLTNTVCVAYKQPPTRTLVGASERSQEAFNSILRETRANTRLKSIERRAFALNVDIVVPVVRPDLQRGRKRLDLDEMLPHHTEVTLSETDPMGTPIAAVSHVRDASDRTDSFPIRTIVLDAQSWRTYDDRGRRVGLNVDHGAGVFPGVPFRFENPLDDWWMARRGDGGVQATLSVAHIFARLDWVRAAQDRKREMVFAKNTERIPKQYAGGVLVFPFTPQEAEYGVKDTVTDPKHHIEHIRFVLEQAAESLGIPSTLVDFDPSMQNAANSPLGAARKHEALAEVRRSHIEFLVEQEKRLWVSAARVMRGMGHPLSGALSPEMIEETLEIDFPPLTFTEHPLTQLQILEKEISLGVSSTVRGYRRMHTDTTEKEAWAAVEAIADEEGKINDFYVERNIPRDAEQRRQTLAQVQGREGGRQRGERQNDEDGNEPGGADDQSDGDTPEPEPRSRGGGQRRRSRR
jgi:hypothetical protein